MNHCENATKIREAILLREFATFRLKSASNHCENATKTPVNIHSETLSRAVLSTTLIYSQLYGTDLVSSFDQFQTSRAPVS